jgi:uncharacterized protein YhaN
MMRIKRIIIEGFGHFRDASLENIPGGLVLISGDNEAGKSTLLGFIRAILFGFPTARSKENRYQPLAGGRHGGQIVVWTENQGEVIIQRVAGQRGSPVNLLFTRNGTRGSEEELKQLLKGFNRVIYKNIYAFSLEELQTFNSLNTDDVKGALYGAGSGTSLMAIPASMKKLESNLKLLFKPGGSKPLINEKLADLEEVRGKIRTAASGIRDYEDMVLKGRNINLQIEELKQEKDSFEIKQDRIKNYLKLWDQWIILQDTEAKLHNLPEIVAEFPNDGLIKLESFNESLENSEKSLVKEEKKLADLNTEMKSLVIDKLLIANEVKICELNDDLNIYKNNLQELSKAQQSLGQKKADIHRELANLGSNWTEKRVYSIDRSLFTQKAIQQHQESQKAAASELERAREALSCAKVDYETAQKEEKNTEEELQGFKDLKPQMDKDLLSAIQRGRDQFASLIKELPKRHKELKDASSALVNSVKEIDQGWNISHVESFDCSIPAQEKIQQFEQELSAANNKISDTKKELEFQESNLSDIQKELNTTREKCQIIPEPSLKTKNEFVSRKNHIKTLRNNFNEKKLLNERISLQKELLKDKLKTLPGLQSSLHKLSDRHLKLLAIIFSLIGAIMVIGLIVFERPWGEVIAGIIFFILGPVLFGVHKFIEKQKNRLIEKKEEIKKIETEIAGQNNKLNNLKSQVEEITTLLELSKDIEDIELIDEVFLDKIENHIQEELDNFNDKCRLEEDLNKISDKENKVKKIIEKIIDNLKSSEEAFKQLNREWEEHLQNLSLKPGIKPGMVNLIFSKIEGTKNRVSNMNTLEEKIKKMEDDRDEYYSLLAQVPEPPRKNAVDPDDLPAIIDKFLEQVKNTEKRRQERDFVCQTLKERQKKCLSLLENVDKATRRFQEAVNRQNRALDDWHEWLSKKEFDPGISPETASGALITINKCIEFMDAKSELENSIKQKKDQIEKFRVSSDDLFLKISKPPPGADNLDSQIKLVYNELGKSKLALENKKSLEIQHKSTLGEIDVVRQEIEDQKGKIRRLLKEGGANDENAFRTRGKLFKEREKLLAESENAVQNMKKISGESNLKALKEILIPYSKEKIEEENRDLQRNIQEIEDKLEQAHKELAKTDTSVGNLSSSDDIARLRAEEEILKEEIRTNAKKWGINAIARYLLIQAREKFEKENQPKVIKEASRFFTSFTGGEYRDIIAPLGEQSIEVLSSKGKQKKPGQLSRASAEQLFLALRFGYMSNYAGSSEGLPVIMDDILVNFDPTRASNTVRTIFELAETHQVLFFTCHPEILSIFKKQKAGVPVYYIKDGGFIPPG